MLHVDLQVMYWLGEMCEELQERLDLDLEMNNRKAKLLVFHAAVHLVCKVYHNSAQLLVVCVLAALCFLFSFFGVSCARIINIDYG